MREVCVTRDARSATFSSAEEARPIKSVAQVPMRSRRGG